ncbi:MAG: glutaredoxin family protein [Mariprofundaceae bacterium]|nr:glutaredoxin family protein [Mariprofundaceae bacterium]
MQLPHVQIMSRSQCCLCDDAKAVVSRLAEQPGMCTWEVVRIDADAGLMRRYGLDVPVILIDGVVTFRHRVSPEALAQALREAKEQKTTVAVEDMA